MGIKKVGVVGGGFMGSGIVQVCARSGYDVVLLARREQSLSKGIATIEHYLSRVECLNRIKT
jgi:3-hydroxybutyryl-CoA dehydrogenase